VEGGGGWLAGPAHTHTHAHTHTPYTQTALQELKRLRVLPRLMRNLCQLRVCVRIIRMQHAARVHRLLLRRPKVVEGVG